MKIGIFNWLKFFGKKVTSSVDKLVDTKTRLEYIKDHYDEEVQKYTISSKGLFVTEKQLKEKVDELTNRGKSLKAMYERQVRDNELVKGKATYIRWKGCQDAYDMTKAAYNSVAEQCEQVRANLEKVGLNKELLAAKIDFLNSKIDAIKLTSKHSNIKFSIDCDAMLKEVEDEIKLNQYQLEAQQEIDSIMNHNAEEDTVVDATGVDAEWEEVCRQLGRN